MRLKKKDSGPLVVEGDMTPMIDMTFQLIAFFMVIINFSEGEQDQRIRLPSSELAKPPETAFEIPPITLQLTKDGTVLFSGDELPISGLTQPLLLEKQIIERRNQNMAEAMVIIRADGDAQTGVVQELIQKAQDIGFEQFALRAKQEDAAAPGGT